MFRFVTTNKAITSLYYTISTQYSQRIANKSQPLTTPYHPIKISHLSFTSYLTDFIYPSISISSYYFDQSSPKHFQTNKYIEMSFTISTSFFQPLDISKSSQFGSKSKVLSPSVVCSGASEDKSKNIDGQGSLKALSAALALSSILVSSTVPALPALADISGLTPCKESKQFAKREKQSLKKLESSLKLYAPDSAPALAIKATMEKTKRR